MVSETEKGENLGRSSYRDRFLRAGSRCAALVLVLTLIFAPLAAAKPIAGIVKAPFNKAVVATYNNIVTQGCGVAYNVKNPSWNASTGKGVLAEYATANSCASQSGYVGTDTQGYSFAEYDIGIPVAIGGNGYYHFKVAWATHLTAANTFNAGSCAASNATPYYCDSFALWYTSAGSGVYDVTNNTWLPYATALVCWNGGCSGLSFYPYPVWTAFNETHNYTNCNYGTCGNQNTTSPSTASFLPNSLIFYLNSSWRLIASHTYAILSFFYAEAWVSMYSSNTKVVGATGTVNFNGGTLGNYEKLTSVSWR